MRPRRLALAVSLAALAGAPAGAQEDPLPRILVKPHAAEKRAEEDPRARQERLLRRMQQADYLFRNICRNCGGAIEGPGAYDPFDPVARLAAGRAPDPPRPAPPPASAPAPGEAEAPP